MINILYVSITVNAFNGIFLNYHNFCFGFWSFFFFFYSLRKVQKKFVTFVFMIFLKLGLWLSGNDDAIYIGGKRGSCGVGDIRMPRANTPVG